MLKRFHLERKEDISGISGCGNVAYGVLLLDKSALLQWSGSHSSIAIYKSIDDLLFIHGHCGSTILVWDDN